MIFGGKYVFLCLIFTLVLGSCSGRLGESFGNSSSSGTIADDVDSGRDSGYADERSDRLDIRFNESVQGGHVVDFSETLGIELQAFEDSDADGEELRESCYDNGNSCQRAPDVLRQRIGNLPSPIKAFRLKFRNEGYVSATWDYSYVVTAKLDFHPQSGKAVFSEVRKTAKKGNGAVEHASRCELGKAYTVTDGDEQISIMPMGFDTSACDTNAPNPFGLSDGPVDCPVSTDEKEEVLSAIYLLEEGNGQNNSELYTDGHAFAAKVWPFGVDGDLNFDNNELFRYLEVPSKAEQIVAEKFGRYDFDNPPENLSNTELPIFGDLEDGRVIIGFCIMGDKRIRVQQGEPPEGGSPQFKNFPRPLYFYSNFRSHRPRVTKF